MRGFFPKLNLIPGNGLKKHSKQEYGSRFGVLRKDHRRSEMEGHQMEKQIQPRKPGWDVIAIIQELPRKSLKERYYRGRTEKLKMPVCAAWRKVAGKAEAPLGRAGPGRKGSLLGRTAF